MGTLSLIYEDELVKLYCGDCVQVMRELDENSIDAIVTDPPYGLEFMGKDWDKLSRNLMNPTSDADIERKKEYGNSYAGRRSNLPDYKGRRKIDTRQPGDLNYTMNNTPSGRSKVRYSSSQSYGGSVGQEMQFWHYRWAVEALRVLKPGGYCLAFGGTRTFNRLASALEDAGLEFRDTIMYLYGCLSEDTEVLTLNGWEHYHKDIDKSIVLCYNIQSKEFIFDKSVRSFVYENKDTAYSIKSDFTDQIVSRNHNCIVERNGREVFIKAEALEQQENIPFLESLSDLPETIYCVNKGTSVTKQELFKLCQGDMGEMEYREKAEKNNLSNLQERILSDRSKQKQSEKILFKKLFRESKRLVKKIFGKWKGEIQPEESSFWKRQPRLERWGNLFQNTWKLYRSKVYTVSKRIFTNGTQRWLCCGTSYNNGAEIGQTYFENGSCTSQRPQFNQQSNREFNVIQNKSGTQKIRRTKASVTPIVYNGIVWCIETNSGAFVVRRNGKIFITGNSGFPKSLNVSKAIDKMKGVEREVTGVTIRPTGRAFADGLSGFSKGETLLRDEPVTPEAKEWDGWGTALKPAWEPILIFRKPIEGTVAENVLKWKTGGINIDACRIELQIGDEKDLRIINRNVRKQDDGWGMNDIKEDRVQVLKEQGRFPANLVLDGSDEVEELFPNTKSGSLLKHHNRTGGMPPIGTFEIRNRTGEKEFIGDFGSASRFFYTAKPSKEERNLGLELEDGKFMDEGREEGSPGGTNPRNRGAQNARRNFHPTIKPVELMKWLITLVSRKDSLILDPFLGSGSTLVACKKLGRRAIGIEKDPEYIKIAEKRLKAPLQKTFI